MKHFIFLEFLDARVEATLRELRDALNPNSRSSSPVHITLRGPYRQEPDPQYMRQLSEHLKGRGVRIIGAGLFTTSFGYSVFLRAESSAFRNLWWKPDFQTPIEKIQPHLTLFETADKTQALLAFNFLKASRISVLTYSVQLSIFTTGQKDLFGTRAISDESQVIARNRDIVAIDQEILPAARELGFRLASMSAQDLSNVGSKKRDA